MLDLGVAHARQVRRHDIRRGLKHPGERADAVVPPSAVVKPRQPRLAVQERCRAGVKIGARVDPDDSGCGVDQGPGAGNAPLGARELASQEGHVDLAAVPGQRPALRFVSREQVQQGGLPQMQAAAALPGSVQGCRLRGGPEDIVGEVPDEPEGPGQQRSHHGLRDPVGAVLAAPVRMRLGPVVQMGRIECETVADLAAVEPQQADRRLAVSSQGPAPGRGEDVPVIVLKVTSGQRGHRRPRACRTVIEPAPEEGKSAELLADRAYRHLRDADRVRPVQQQPEQVLRVGPVAVRDVREVQRQRLVLVLKLRRPQVPPVVAEAGR